MTPMNRNPMNIEAAALALQVPASGVPWLDDLITEARRQRASEQAMMMLMLHNTLMEFANRMDGTGAGSPWSEQDIAVFANAQAQAMIDARQLPLDFQ